ncbi:pantothenate transporter liz1 [Phyllosticta citricarpa]|uniref:Pantothenate transporter liz1 n=2 Tax=Phyllosticta TaxID=121621 RepID=A0ABR1LVH0_9PEZI
MTADNHISDSPTASMTVDEKIRAERIDLAEIGESGSDALRREAPALVRSMSPEQRAVLEKKLVRRIDRRLMPMLILMYILNYIDRNNIAAARLAGLEEDLGLHGHQYLTAVSILFVGYLLMQVPSNLMLNKIGRPSLYLPVFMVLWGIISTATAACQDFSGLVACRFFLGFVEAAYFPGCLFFLSSWYTRKELGMRTAFLYSGALISGAFSGLISAGVKGGMDGLHGLRAWRWLFIIEGAITVGVGAIAVFIIPDFPRTTKWLSDEERELAVWRLQEDVGMDDWTGSEDQSFFHGFKLAATDVKTYIMMALITGHTSAGTVTTFFPSVVETLGYDTVNTYLLTAPPYCLAVITTYLNAWHADRTGERYYHVTLPFVLGIVSFIIAACTTSMAPRYFAMIVMLPGIYTGYPVALGWISNIIPRPPAKRAAAIAMINAVSNSSQIFMPYVYIDAPRYIPAFATCSCCLLVSITSSTILRFILVRLNKKLDRGEHVEGAINAGQAIPGEAAEKGFRFLV